VPVAELFSDYTLRTVALGAAILGAVSGILGSFAVLRKQSLLGDAVSHAALPGIVGAFMLTGSKAPLVLIVGAGVAGWVSTLVVAGVVTTTRVKYDSALGLVLSVFFGLGLMMLTFLQKQPEAAQAGLENFLFGQAAALVTEDVVTMAVLAAVVTGAVVLFWKQFKIVSFDPEFGRTLGFRVRGIDLLLTALLVVAISIGLQTVGVVLMSAMVVAPAAAARQWTDRLGPMVVLAALFGALAGMVGAVTSSSADRIPTGPSIVIAISMIVVVSMLAAPGRGLLARAIADRRSRARLRAGAVLEDLYVLGSQHEDPSHAHSVGVLRTMNNAPGTVAPGLQALRDRGWAKETAPDEWVLTPEGRSAAEQQGRGSHRETEDAS
jgi:manganese/zinc/iron transport system permease protein